MTFRRFKIKLKKYSELPISQIMNLNAQVKNYKPDLYVRALCDSILSGSMLCFQKYCPNVQIAEIKEPDEEFRIDDKECLSMIMLWGSENKIIFKTYYNQKDVSYFYSKATHTSIQDANIKMNNFWMKEYSNLQGGYFRGVIEEYGILVGMSLPFLTSGKDESLFIKRLSSETYKTNWQYKSEGYVLTFSLEINLSEELMDKGLVDFINKKVETEKQKAPADEGEIEFL